MKILRNLIIFISLMLISKIFNAQTGKDFAYKTPNNITNDMQINMYTGMPNVSIPLWNATSGNLNLPISVYYSSNGEGQKFEIPSEVGLKWRLSAGGSISQTVRGLKGTPDTADINTINGTYVYNIFMGNKDGEPDIYNVNLPGLSFSFTTDDDINFFPLIQSDVKIEKLNNVSTDEENNGFLITSANGTKYYFERSYSIGHRTVNISSADISDWKIWIPTFLLTKIEDVNGTSSIEIEYSSQQKKIYYGYTGIDIGTWFLEDQAANENVYIKKIITENEIINFNIEPKIIDSNTIADIPSGFDIYDRILDSIVIQDKNMNIVKQYNFNYIEKDKFLEQIDDIDLTTKEVASSYSFGYKSEETDNENDSIDCLSSLWVPSRFLLQSTIIEEIHYPSGAFIEFEYEHNRYNCLKPPTGQEDNEDYDGFNQSWFYILSDRNYDVWLNSDNGCPEPSDAGSYYNEIGPGLRVKKITNYSKRGIEESYKEFDYSQDNIGRSSGRLSHYTSKPNEWDTENPQRSYLVEIEKTKVVYKKVTVYEGGKNDIQDGEDFGNNGKIEYYYSFEKPQIIGTYMDSELQLPENEFNGLLKKTIVKDKSNKILSETINTYSTTKNTQKFVKGVKAEQTSYLPNHFEHTDYKIYQKKVQLLSTEKREYSNNNIGGYITNTNSFDYGTGNRIQKTTTTNSTGDIICNYFTYPDEISDNVYNEMVNKNALATVVKKETKKNTTLLSGKKTEFGYHAKANGTQIIVPKKTQAFEFLSYKTVKWFDKYNNKGNLLESHGIDNIHNSIIYNSDNSQIIANVINANEGEVFHDDFEELTENYSTNSYTGKYSKKISGSEGSNAFAGVHDFNVNELVSDKYTYSAWFNTNTEGVLLVLKEWSKSPWQSYTVPNTNGKWEYYEFTADIGSFTASKLRCEIWANGNNALVDNVRFHPTDAYMNTATYKPLIGKTSETDANGISVFYEYDDNGRLAKTFNQDKKLINERLYNVGKNISFDIIPNITGSIKSGCKEVILTIENIQNYNTNDTLIWQWFEDSAGKNLIAEGLTITYTPTTDSSTVFVCPVLNGRKLKSKSYEFNIEPGKLTVNNEFYYYEVWEGEGADIFIPFEYDACDDIPLPYSNQYYNLNNIFSQNSDSTFLFKFEEITNGYEPYVIGVKWGMTYIRFARAIQLECTIGGYHNSNDGPDGPLYYKAIATGGNGTYMYSWDGGESFSSNCESGIPEITKGTCVVRSGSQEITLSFGVAQP